MFDQFTTTKVNRDEEQFRPRDMYLVEINSQMIGIVFTLTSVLRFSPQRAENVFRVFSNVVNREMGSLFIRSQSL